MQQILMTGVPQMLKHSPLQGDYTQIYQSHMGTILMPAQSTYVYIYNMYIHDK